MKKIFLILFTLLSLKIAFAQVTQEWAQRYNGPGNSADDALAVEVDNNGNVYVTGRSSIESSPNFDYATIKYSSDGAEKWVQRYNGPGNGGDEATALAVDNQGNVYVTGTSWGSGTGHDYATIKYNTNGAEQWVQRYDGEFGDDVAKAIAVDIAGNVYVTGWSVNEGGTSTDYATIKYNSAGVEQWVQSYNDGSATSIAVDNLGNVYVNGITDNGCTTIKYNTNGAEQWVQNYNGGVCVSIAVDNEGNVYVSGVSNGIDYLTIKYDSTGVEQWAQIYNGPGNGTDVASANAVDNKGNIYVTGRSLGSNSIYDCATIKYNSDGVEQWVQIYNAGIATSISVDNDGNVYIAGNSNADYLTIKYDTDGIEQWVQSYNGPGGLGDFASSIAISNEGQVYVTGSSVGIGSQLDYATIKYSQLAITNPTAGEKWIAGEPDTIRWIGGQAGQSLTIEYSLDNGNTYSVIIIGTPADSGNFIWNLPNTLLSTRVKIKLSDISDPNINAVSDSFRIKPYLLTRLDANGDYIAYNINTDRWGFSNQSSDMWPRFWFQQFNYRGTDPFTNQQYPQQGYIAFKVAPDSIYPDWVSWVNTFGISACYLNVSAPVYSPNAILQWQRGNNRWNGSCFGIAGANALAFSNKSQFQNRFPNFPGFVTPISVTSDNGVKSVVNELFTHQIGNPTQQTRTGRWNVITPNQTLNEIKSMLKEDSVSIRTLSLWNNNGTGGHTILVYSLEQDETQKELFYLFVYDNSYPNNLNALILIDTTGNSNQGTWLTTYGWTTWGGPKRLILEIESVNYLSNATLLKNNNTSKSPFILETDQLEISANINANTRIMDMQGNISGFINGQVFEEIPESVPLIYLNGSETPPYGYSLQTENYSVILNQFEDDNVEAFFFTGNKSFVYERDNVSVTQTDRLFFDGGVSVVNPDAQNKTIRLLNLINETTQEKLAVVSSLELAQNDSVKIENPDSNKVKLISYGSAKDYDIDLNYSTANGIGRFANSSVILTANTSHTFLPDWTNLSNSQLVVLVDVGNNGTIDDTLHIINTVGVEDEGNQLMPTEFNLAQNYPNPFNPVTTIQYSIPQRSNVILKVYDVLGNEVATLVNEEKERGVYSISFDASQLSSGIYLYRMQAGNFIETKKMILIK